MTRLKVVEEGEGKSKELLEQVKSKMGRVPNILKGMANSPAALEVYLSLSGTLMQSGALSGKEREAVALAIAEKNECTYCAAAHTVIGSMQGIDADSAKEHRRGRSSEPKLQALISLALEIVETKGFVKDETLSKAREVGYTDAHIAELVANVALNVYTNYFNHVNDTELDFPEAPKVS